jgi:hypothetical protein
MKLKHKSAILFIAAGLLGIVIAWIDSRPTWDDTGITVAMILVGTAILGFALPRHAWVSALLVGIWIPAWNILQHNNYTTLFTLIVGFIGAYAGAFIRRLISQPETPHTN